MLFTAYDLRHRLTTTEKILWRRLRAHQCAGYKFRRQHQIGRTIVDFVCLKEKLIVELDGEVHNKQKDYDMRRDSWLRQQGYHVVRFQNEEVENNIEKVFAHIRAILFNLTAQRSGS